MIRIYGNSDDQICIERDGKREQHDGDDKTFLVGDARGGMFVKIAYGVGCSIAVWRIEVSQIDEAIPLPWPTRLENPHEMDHSLTVVIECPAGTPISEAPEDEDDDS